MKEQRIKDYLNNGGKLFSVKSIDMYRDGGTKVIETNLGGIDYVGRFFFIDKDTNEIFRQYPCEESSLLKDELLRDYLILVLETYTTRCLEQANRQCKWIADIKSDIK